MMYFSLYICVYMCVYKLYITVHRHLRHPGLTEQQSLVPTTTNGRSSKSSDINQRASNLLIWPLEVGLLAAL